MRTRDFVVILLVVTLFCLAVASMLGFHLDRSTWTFSWG